MGRKINQKQTQSCKLSQIVIAESTNLGVLDSLNGVVKTKTKSWLPHSLFWVVGTNTEMVFQLQNQYPDAAAAFSNCSPSSILTKYFTACLSSTNFYSNCCEPLPVKGREVARKGKHTHTNKNTKINNNQGIIESLCRYLIYSYPFFQYELKDKRH